MIYIYIQEHRYYHSELGIKYYDTGNEWGFVSVSVWKSSNNVIIGGEEMLLSLHALKSLNRIEKIQPRMMCASFNGNPDKTIISFYSPTNACDETGVITFYNELSSLVRRIPKHIIGGDTNALIGKDETNKFCLHNSSNRNREYLTDPLLEIRLSCLNTKFQKREGKLWTYTYPNNTKAQRDYILINKKWINSVLNCETYISFEGVSSDYRIVTGKIRLR